MATNILINEDVKQQLKVKSAELGVKQIDLLNRYVIEGIERDNISKKSPPTIEEIKQLLDHDKPEGNNLKDFIGIVPDGDEFDPVDDKRKAYRG